MDLLNIYVIIIFIVKLIFLYFLLAEAVSKAKLKKDNSSQNMKEYKKNAYFKERIELLFKFLMSIFLIYVFYPRRKIPIVLTMEMRVLLFIFGIVLIVSAKWHDILEHSFILHPFPLS